MFAALAAMLAPVAGAIDISDLVDRNALQAAVRTGDAIVAVMASGNLLRFDALARGACSAALRRTRGSCAWLYPSRPATSAPRAPTPSGACGSPVGALHVSADSNGTWSAVGPHRMLEDTRVVAVRPDPDHADWITSSRSTAASSSCACRATRRGRRDATGARARRRGPRRAGVCAGGRPSAAA
jgi:hypothetical protein